MSSEFLCQKNKRRVWGGKLTQEIQVCDCICDYESLVAAEIGFESLAYS